MKIPVVMVSDDNFISQIRVAVWTMRKSTYKDIFLEITILCSKELGPRSRKRLKELESVLLNLNIRFYEVDLNIFIKAKPMGHVPVASFYRLIIADAMKEYEKCLFLDGDLIVNTDLRALYLQDMEGFYIAGVRDNEFLYNPDSMLRHLENYGFQNFCNYVNAGVIVFNLAKIREEHLQDRFLECMKKDYPYMDQDIINKVCGGKIKQLDIKYNLFSRCKNVKRFEFEDNNRIADVEWKILHFAGFEKPWQNFRIYGAKEWWKWAREALEEEVYQSMYHKAEEAIRQSDWSYILEQSALAEKIVVVGYSYIGIDVFVSLKKSNKTADIYYADNSTAKQGLSDKNVTIYSLKKLAERYPKALWINTSQRSYQEINIQLKRLGISEDHIITYRYKDNDYYEMLEDEYFMYEIQQRQLKMQPL